MTQKQRIEDVAREVFGFQALRPGQLQAVEAVLDGQDMLAVMPTGAGKSAIYQLAAVLIDGPTVVVSPLIALQRDQVMALQAHDTGGAAQANSTVGVRRRREAFESMRSGNLEFLFLAPEQFNNPETLTRLGEAAPSLFVVDEAHCISAWGHDFRPEYLRLGAVIEELGRPQVLALTATAAPPVRAEIVERLGMRDPKILVAGFDRPNIHLSSRLFNDDDQKTETLLDLVTGTPGAGLVYVATRRAAEELAEQLRLRGVRAAAYHGGLASKERDEVQGRFMDSDVAVVVATVAFGMGINKPDVRFVYHHAISDSLDSYYHEIGRAGRDGQPAKAILLYRPQDVGLRRFFAGSGHVDQDQIEQVATAVLDAGGSVDSTKLQEQVGLSQSKLSSAVSRLERVGAVEVLADGGIAFSQQPHTVEEAAAAAAQAEEARRQLEDSRVAMMRLYAETRDCRREFLLNYFGQAYDAPCGSCDNCDAGLVSEQGGNEGDQPFALNSRVAHPEWGEGLVMRYEDGNIVVLFDEAGYKTLVIDLVIDHDLLRIIS